MNSDDDDLKAKAKERPSGAETNIEGVASHSQGQAQGRTIQ